MTPISYSLGGDHLTLEKDHFWGDHYCQDMQCRLYNAHWQQEVISAQLEGQYEFCPFHQDILRQLCEEMVK